MSLRATTKTATPEPQAEESATPIHEATALTDSRIDTGGLFHRPARSTVPVSEPEPHNVNKPPMIEDTGAAGMGFIGLIPLIGIAAAMSVMMLLRNSPFAAVGAIMMVVTVIGAIVMMMSQSGKATRKRQRARNSYLEYLESVRDELTAKENQRRQELADVNPPPDALIEYLATPWRAWERRRHHSDFLDIRLGVGDGAGSPIRLQGEEDYSQQTDPHLTEQLQVLQDRFATTPELPLTLNLAQQHTVSVIGSSLFCSTAIRNIILQLISLHSPEDVHLAVAVPRHAQAEWSWLRRVPHILDQRQPTQRGPLPRLAPSMPELAKLLKQDLAHRYQSSAESRRNTIHAKILQTAVPRLIIIDLTRSRSVENFSVPGTETSHQLGVTVIHAVAEQLDEPGEISARIKATGNIGETQTRIENFGLAGAGTPQTFLGALDDSGPALAAGISRMVAPMRLDHDSLEHTENDQAQSFTKLLEMTEMTDQALERAWQPRMGPDFLKVPIGLDDAGDPVLLDIKESAHNGMGPHGLCVGATGSGKSELLRTLVLSLALTHPPDMLNLVLVDYKGGATFAPFAGIPHVSGIVTNLADDVSLVDRIYSSLQGEILRRQELLSQAGNLSSITEYQQLRHRLADTPEGEAMPPLPHLFLVIDEFGELLSARPDFIELFMSIGRIGRSIGVHLLLSSQRLEGGKIRGLDTYLSYRLGLRTLSEAESRTVLETPDAFHLPPLPGYGYLKVDTTVYTRFRAGFVSGPMAAETTDDSVPVTDHPGAIPEFYYASELLDDIARVRAEELEAEHQHELAEAEGDEGCGEQELVPGGGLEPETQGPTVLGTAVELMRSKPRVTDPIWLAPLPDSVSLDVAVASTGRTKAPGVSTAALAETPTAGRGTHRHDSSAPGPLTATLGLLDDPAHQWQGPWQLDLTRAGGHVVILGGPSSGKSTALKTLALSLSDNYDPRQVSIFGLDLKGTGLLGISELPHVAGVAGRTRRERLRRTVEEVADLLTEREQIFEEREIDSLATMRQLFDDGQLPNIDVRDVVLIVDGWGGLLEEFDELQDAVYSILTRGGGFGIHVIATATRWNEIRLAQQSFFGTRLELKLSEPADSVHGSKIAKNIPGDKPGRGFHTDGLIGQIALPRLDANPDPATLGQGLSVTITQITQKNPVSSPHTVRLLPHLIRQDELVAPTTPGTLRLGMMERDSSTRYLDLTGSSPHLLMMGDNDSGKTSTLIALAQELMSQYTSEELVFAVCDPRRELHEVIPEPYMGGYATSASLATQLSEAVVKELTNRVPQDPTPGAFQPSSENQIVLLVDDYDVLAAGGVSPLTPFVPFVPMGVDINFHVLMARRIRGVSRAMFEPFITSVRETGATTIMLDGDPDEGRLIGRNRPRKFPVGRGMIIGDDLQPRTIQLAAPSDIAQRG
ncbi:type VII secretion protein EccCa [Auritidibacter sp. NML130574]|uniref:type VII secretion protein EccCa n=1 Tax=Auritidibacter sp. NML130574 TaxID=2170745 RepID=UPI001FEE8C2E|nr:type VII secretion protein EccCa [Auritidibacter sp. NML130574]